MPEMFPALNKVQDIPIKNQLSSGNVDNHDALLETKRIHFVLEELNTKCLSTANVEQICSNCCKLYEERDKRQM